MYLQLVMVAIGKYGQQINLFLFGNPDFSPSFHHEVEIYMFFIVISKQQLDGLLRYLVQTFMFHKE